MSTYRKLTLYISFQHGIKKIVHVYAIYLSFHITIEVSHTLKKSPEV